MATDDLTHANGELERLRAEVARLSTDLASSQQREAALQDQLTATAEFCASSPRDRRNPHRRPPESSWTARLVSVLPQTSASGA